MPVTVVVGGQYGSEGKGKVCAHLTMTDHVDCMVRCGGRTLGIPWMLAANGINSGRSRRDLSMPGRAC